MCSCANADATSWGFVLSIMKRLLHSPFRKINRFSIASAATRGECFKFLMEYKKISYVESVQELAEELGITIDYDEKYVEAQSEQEVLYDINTSAARYFSNTF